MLARKRMICHNQLLQWNFRFLTPSLLFGVGVVLSEIGQCPASRIQPVEIFLDLVQRHAQRQRGLDRLRTLQNVPACSNISLAISWAMSIHEAYHSVSAPASRTTAQVPGFPPLGPRTAIVIGCHSAGGSVSSASRGRLSEPTSGPTQQRRQRQPGPVKTWSILTPKNRRRICGHSV